MLILELAVQSVRGFSPSARIALKPGYLGLKAPTEISSPLAGLFLALCYPDGRGGDGAFLAQGAKSGRAGFAMQGNDGLTWRVVRDLGGSGALHTLNPQTSTYEVVTQDSSEIAQVLRSTVGLLPRTTFEQLFTFTPSQMPTKRPKLAKTQTIKAKGNKTGLQSAYEPSPSSASVSPEDAKARIAILENELKGAKEAADVQFRMDGVQSEIFKLEEKLRAFDALNDKLEAARAEYASAPTPQNLGLPDDIVDRVRRYPDEKKKHNEALRKLADERERALGLDTATSVAPVHTDPRFTGSVGAGLVLVLAGAMLDGNLRYVAMLAIPAFTFAALLALRYIEDLQHVSREGAKSEVFNTREKKLTDDFALANMLVESAMEKVNATTADEFQSAMQRGEELKPALVALEQQHAEYQADPETPYWAERIQSLKNEQDALNQQLLDMSGGYARDAREIEREIAKLNDSLAPAAAPEPSVEFSSVPTGPAETFDDPCPAMMVLASDLFSTDVPALWAIMHDRAVQYYSALTDRRYHGIELDKDGRATVDAPGRSISVNELPGRDLDLLYTSLRLTLIEKYSAQGKVPVLIEDAFAGLIDVPKQALFGRMLKHLGTLTQVLHVSGREQTLATADAMLTL
ncbi:MAG: chromosome segregation protein SMC [Archangium sp.]|nr:chromosome segregation protein SMC [Archangium sp.]